MTHPLDRPIWDSLLTGHRSLAAGGADAKRFPEDVSPFVGIPNDSPKSITELAQLLDQVQEGMIIQAAPVICPDGCQIVQQAEGVQMMFTGSDAPIVDHDQFQPLEKKDAAEMVELATLTKPGPFKTRTHELGNFLGVRHENRLIAMAGERLVHKDYVELSAVCTHPDFRGKGLARLLSLAVTASIIERGKRPYLQAYASNTAAIDLYERIGYRVRTRLEAAVLRRAQAA